MILESWPWKRDLARRAEVIRLRKTQQRWSEASFAAVERDLFVSAYSIRKLMDAGKISDEVESMSFEVTYHRPRGSRAVDFMNRDKLDELYDLSRGTATEISIRKLCNQIIHSFVFTPMLEEGGGLAGFFVASDSEKERRLLYFSVDALINVLVRVAEDDIVSMSVRRDMVGGPAKIVTKSSRPEPAR